MIPVCTAAESRALDQQAIEVLGLPGIALMELAAKGVAERIRTHHWRSAHQGTTVVCGVGNNGGDGYAIARWLHTWGVPVSIASVAVPKTTDATLNAQACARLGIPTTDHLGDVGLLVDALFGTGLTRPVQGSAATWVDALNRHPAPVVSVDLPSGMHADTGMALGPAVRASRTVALGCLKRGLTCATGRALAGDVDVVDLGIAPAGRSYGAELLDADGLKLKWPTRPPHAHKTRAGHLFVVAGSTSMAGAASLTCTAALRAGVGLVTLVTPRGAHTRLGSLPPEIMVVTSGEGDVLEAPPPDVFERATGIAVGPGLGGGSPLSPSLARWLEALWTHSDRPMVFDADALPYTSSTPSVAQRVITPHSGEAARLLGCSVSEIDSDRFGSVETLCGSHITALLKGPWTLVAHSGKPIAVNPVVSPVLATAGTGDVLTGVVGSLLARGISGYDAASLAGWVHGMAGKMLEAERPVGWTALDVARALPNAIHTLISTSDTGVP